MRKSRGERAASRQKGQPVPGGRNEGFPAGSVLILPSLQGIQVKATETSSIHLEKEMDKEADSFARTVV